MALFTLPLRLLPLLLLGSLHPNAFAQQGAMALLRPARQAEPQGRAPARTTSLESVLEELKTAHHASFIYRSELVKDKFVSFGGLVFPSWEDKLTYAVTASGLRVEKTRQNVFIISGPKLPASSPQSIGVGAGPGAAGPVEALAPVAPVALVVQGQVSGPDQAALPGVTVLVKGTTNGTTTDAGGNFSLSLPDATATLVVSAIGFVTQEVALGGRTQLTIVLQTDVQALEEVVVVGYAVQKKADLTGPSRKSARPTLPAFR